MSIIHDALKKVQESLGGRPREAASDDHLATMVPPDAQASVPVPLQNKQSSPLMIVGVGLVLLLGGYFLYQQRHLLIPKINSITTKVIPAQKPKALGPLAKVPSSSANTATGETQELSIQGVMSNNGLNVALINGKIYTAGDSINGIKITEITTENITLLRDGKEEKVRVRH